MRKNCLLVKYGGGFLERQDATDIANVGRFEGYVTLDTSSREEAERLADALLVELATTPEPAISVGMEVTGGDEPYVSFTVGDTVGIVVTDGALPLSEQRRVVSLTVSHDEDGNPIYTPELNRSTVPPEAQALILVRQLGDKASFSDPTDPGKSSGGASGGGSGGGGAASTPAKPQSFGGLGTPVDNPSRYTLGETGLGIGGRVVQPEAGVAVNGWHYFEYDSDVEADSRPAYSLVQFVAVGGGTSAYVDSAFLGYEGAWHVNRESMDGVTAYRLHYWVVEVDLSNNWWSNFKNSGGGSVTPSGGAQMCLQFWNMAPFIGAALIAQNPGDIDDLNLQDSMGTAYFRGSNWMAAGLVSFDGLTTRYPCFMDITNGLLDYQDPATGAIVPLAWDDTIVQSGALALRLSFASHYLPEHDADGGPVKAESTWHDI